MKIEINQNGNQTEQLKYTTNKQIDDLFENLLKSPAGQMSDGQYHLTQLDQLEQSSLDFHTNKKQPQNYAKTKSNIDSTMKEKNTAIDKELNITEQNLCLPKSELKIIIQEKNSNTNLIRFLPSTFLSIKKRIQDIPGLTDSPKHVEPKEMKQLQTMSSTVNYTAKVSHQKYQLYLFQDSIELSLNSADLSKEELTKFINNLKSTIQKKGLHLALLMINGVKQ